ncbi:MAG: dihydrolipoamide acetyltransferase family protein [Candidatus Zophobacter franzmannii]|nr:dihydrolipoamide acetyltransferase family protein [Candidatus Zophobacter franzmannii]
MRYVFNFPDIGEGLEEGRIIEWYVKKGQAVKMGDALVKMETDKVVTDIPSPKEGVIVTLFGNEGEIVNVGGPLTELEIEGEGEAHAPNSEEPTNESVDEDGFAGVVGTIEVAKGNSFLPSTGEGFEEEIKTEKPKGRTLATPVARAMAKDLGVDINKVKGTGPAQRVTKKDIQAYASKPATSVRTNVVTSDVPDVEITPITQIRKAIARNMAKSKNTAAHMTIFDEVEITTLIDIRKKYKAKFAEDGVKLTYMPFILKALVQSLKKHPMMNSELDLDNSQIIKKNFYNIGIAMDTEDGLVVPVIKSVDQKSIKAIAMELADLAERARDRKLSIDEMRGGTFTLTNYGSVGGWFGVPVINHPQVGILGVGRITKRPIVVDDEIVIGQMLPLSLSVDHRIVDGGETTRFIREFIGYINDPISLIME